MPVEGSVYSLCEPKRALISGRAASILSELDVKDCRRGLWHCRVL